MLVLLRSLQALLLILVMGIGAWRAGSTELRCDMGSSLFQEESAAQAVSDGEGEEKPSGESQDGGGDGAKDGKLLDTSPPKFDAPHDNLTSVGCLNEELPLHGRESIRELFRPPRA